MKTRRCPVCSKPLTENEYQKALGIMGKVKDDLTQQIDGLEAELKASKTRAAQARREGADSQWRKDQRLTKGLREKLQKAQDRIRQLEEGTTPQQEGLDWEPIVVSQLKKAYEPLGDAVKHKGKGGDILHTVRFDGKIAGRIIYECKKCPKVKTEYVQQTHRAKQTRGADFAVLVTTANKVTGVKGFTGFCKIKEVIIIAPSGILGLASLLRMYLVEMLRANIKDSRRAAIALKVVEHVTSPTFRNRLEDIMKISSELQEMVKDEARQHHRWWQKRWDNYGMIEWDASMIQDNLRLVLHGKEPKQVIQTVRIPLRLPSPVEK